METNKFNRKGILLCHDIEKQQLVFNYTGLTPDKLGTYYLVHNSELHQLRKHIEALVQLLDECLDVIQFNEEKVQELTYLLKYAQSKTLHL